MARRTLALAAGLVLVGAACSSSASVAPSIAGIAAPTPAPPPPSASAAASATGSASAATSAQPTASVSAAATASAAASAASTVCKETRAKGAVTVSIKDFAFDPAGIHAKVGEVIRFTNTGFEPHNATLDAGGCGTKTLQTGNVDGLRITVAGTYPFHCTVHTQMTGTITVAR